MTSYGAGLPPLAAAASFVRYSLGAWLPSYVSVMSTPYVAFTYFWNSSIRVEFAEYVQLPTTTPASFWISALISSSVMSLFRIETCFVPAAAALAGAVLVVAPPVLAAGAVLAPPADGDAAPEHAATTRIEATITPSTSRRDLRVRWSIRHTLLWGSSAPPRSTRRRWP